MTFQSDNATNDSIFHRNKNQQEPNEKPLLITPQLQTVLKSS